jgi:hypothetical protein
MRRLLALAAAVAVAAGCHNRNEDQTGAAQPDQGRTDTTAVTHAIDSTRTGPPGVGGRSPTGVVTPDSVGIDSTAPRTDTTTMNAPTSTPQDTLGPKDTGVSDSTPMPSDTATMQHEMSDSMHHEMSDTAAAK